jgi:hypothetical protein
MLNKISHCKSAMSKSTNLVKLLFGVCSRQAESDSTLHERSGWETNSYNSYEIFGKCPDNSTDRKKLLLDLQRPFFLTYAILECM